MQINLLKKLGYDLDFIVIDSPKDIGLKELLNRINKIGEISKKSKSEKLKALYNAYKIINLIDEIEDKAHYLAGYELNRGECKKILNNCKKDALNSKNSLDTLLILKKYKAKLDKINIDKNKNPIKVAIIGEIYTIIEPFSNLYIEDKLMDYGVCSKRRLSQAGG